MAEEAEFVGRVVGVWVKDPAQGAVLENVFVRCLGQRHFLVGRLADRGTGNDPRVGLTYWFPVDDVLTLTIFSDIHEARAAYEAGDQKQSATSSKKSSWWK